MSAAACDADDPYGLDYVAILCRCARGAFGLHAEIEAEIHAEIEAEIEALEKGERHTCMQSARNQHAIITRSELNQHAISMPSTCNQHAIEALEKGQPGTPRISLAASRSTLAPPPPPLLAATVPVRNGRPPPVTTMAPDARV
jgi:hypothetical protein